MKKVFNILAGVAVMASVVACDVEYDPIVIIPNPELSMTGMQAVNTISIYDEQETVINIARTAGLSKDMNINVFVDETLLDEYNFQNTTSFEMLPSEYYTLPGEIFLPKETLDVDFIVITKPAAMVAGLGRTEASNYVLPLRIESPETGIDSKQELVSVLLRPVIDEPKVTVDIPKTMPSLDFISIVHLPQVVDLTAAANFNTLDLNKIEFTPLGEAEVDAYNAANGTDYVLLDSEKYKLKESFDAEAMIFKTAIEFFCWDLDDTKKFLLPIEANSSAYGVEQKEIIYIFVQMSELKVWLSKTEMAATSKQIDVAVEINTAMPNDLEFDLKYDASLVEVYNSANSTSHAALDQELVTIGKAIVKAGDKKGKAVIDLDLGAVPYDEGKFLAPLTIDASSLAKGTIILENQNTIYLVAYNTILGTWEQDTTWRSAWHATVYQKGGMAGSTIKLWQDITVTTPKENQKYGCLYDGDMYVFFDLGSEEIDPLTFEPKVGSGCYAIINLIDREKANDKIPTDYSYLNTTTGELFFDFNVLGYWAPGGAGYGPDSLKPGYPTAGNLYSTRFYNRQDE